MHNTKILAFKNEPFLIDDNAIAEAILTALNLLEALKLSEHSVGRNATRLLKYAEHPTHWLLLIHFCRMPNPADNGFAIRGWPKSRYPSESIVAAAIKTIADERPASARSRHRCLVIAPIIAASPWGKPSS